MMTTMACSLYCASTSSFDLRWASSLWPLLLRLRNSHRPCLHSFVCKAWRLLLAWAWLSLEPGPAAAAPAWQSAPPPQPATSQELRLQLLAPCFMQVGHQLLSCTEQSHIPDALQILLLYASKAAVHCQYSGFVGHVLIWCTC